MKYKDTKRVTKAVRKRRTDNAMVIKKKDKQRSTKHYK